MGQLASSSSAAQDQGRITTEVIPEAELDYERMTQPPPQSGNDGDGDRWQPYLFDSWFNEDLASLLVAPPRVRIVLTDEQIQALRSRPLAIVSSSSSDGDGKDKTSPATPLAALAASLEPHASASRPAFVRTSMCSTKIGTTTRPATSGAEAVKQIIDSERCLRGLAASHMSHSVWLFPWEAACDITREFRVYIRHGHIVALCPYFCAVPMEWLTQTEAERVAEAILAFWEEQVRPRMAVKEGEGTGNEENDEKALEDLVMDVLWHSEEGRCQLIEFNPIFTSGGLLFDWVKDERFMSGRDEFWKAVTKSRHANRPMGTISIQ